MTVWDRLGGQKAGVAGHPLPGSARTRPVFGASSHTVWRKGRVQRSRSGTNTGRPTSPCLRTVYCRDTSDGHLEKFGECYQNITRLVVCAASQAANIPCS